MADVLAVVSKAVFERDARLVLPPLPDDLEQVMRTALARAREDRYASGGDLRAALLACRLDIGSHVLAAAIRELRA